MIATLATLALAADDATWKLEDIYPTVEAFEAARAETAAAVEKFADCRGKLGTDAATLLRCIEQQYAAGLTFGRLSSYASNHAAADTRDDEWAARDQSVKLLGTAFA